MATERQKSDRREKRLAKEEGGKRVAGSGSTPFKKEDVEFKGVLLQDKRTAGRSISVKIDDLYNLEYHAMNAGKVPVFSFLFGAEQEWIAFPRWWLKNQAWWRDLKAGK